LKRDPAPTGGKIKQSTVAKFTGVVTKHADSKEKKRGSERTWKRWEGFTVVLVTGGELYNRGGLS